MNNFNVAATKDEINPVEEDIFESISKLAYKTLENNNQKSKYVCISLMILI